MYIFDGDVIGIFMNLVGIVSIVCVEGLYLWFENEVGCVSMCICLFG